MQTFLLSYLKTAALWKLHWLFVLFCYFCRSPRLVWKVFSFTFCLRCIFAIWHHFVWHGQRPQTHGCFYGFRRPGRVHKAPDQVGCTMVTAGLRAPSPFFPVRAFVPLWLSLLDCSTNSACGMFAAILRGLRRQLIHSAMAPGRQEWCSCHKLNCQLHWNETRPEIHRLTDADWLAAKSRVMFAPGIRYKSHTYNCFFLNKKNIWLHI